MIVQFVCAANIYKKQRRQMTTKFQNPYDKTQRIVKSFYCIGDDGASKDPLYDYLQVSRPEEGQQINITIKQISDNQFLQIYDFPTDKLLRKALQLYFNILSNPTLILYFTKSDSTYKDIQEWVRILKQTHSYFKMVFISDVGTYLQREKIITRVAKEFDSIILQNICFSTLQPNSIHKILANSDRMGIQISTAVCLKPTFREKFSENCRNVIRGLKKTIYKDDSRNESQSVV